MNKEKTVSIEDAQKAIDGLLCSAFIGVCYSVKEESSLAWYVDEDEERMESIGTLLNDLEESDDDYLHIKSFEKKGITEVIIIRGW